MTAEIDAKHFYAVFADVLLALHFIFVCFVVLGLVLIWIGYFRNWRWVRGVPFRLAHIGAMAFVLFETVVGIACPLTVWESELRRLAGESTYSGSFVGHWLERIMYYDLPPEAFLALYTIFFLLIVGSFFVVPPKRRLHVDSSESQP